MKDFSIEQLKGALPQINKTLPGLKRKTAKEMAGPCPWCGGDDRFVVFLDTGRFICRGCTPQGGDVVDFHTRQEGTDFKGLCEKYLDRMDTPKGPKTETGRRSHLYTDVHGTPLYRKTIRGYSDRTKDAFFERHEAGQWLKGLGGCKQTLYNLPGIKTPGRMYLSESEKDADALIGLSLVASSFGGAENWRAEYAGLLAGREVIILTHNDDPGRKAAERTARDLAAKGCTVKVIPGETWGDTKGADVADWLSAGHTRDELQSLVDVAEEWAPGTAANLSGEPETKPKSIYRPISLDGMLSLKLPERGYIISPAIPEQGLVMIYGPRGSGKTWVVLQLAYAAACGNVAFAHWKAPHARRVLYVDGEMPARTIQERLASIVAGSEHEPPDPSYLSILTPDLQDVSMPNLASQEGQEAMQPYIEKADLIIVDNLACLARHGRENDSESWLPVQTWLLSLRRQGKTVVVVHHAGKGGNQRGTSSREDVLDTVVSLRRPNDYEPSEGARFEVYLEKARGIYGHEAMPFELSLRTEKGAAFWISRSIADAEKDRAIELKGEGYSIRDIAAEMGISKSRVQRLLKEVDQ